MNAEYSIHRYDGILFEGSSSLKRRYPGSVRRMFLLNILAFLYLISVCSGCSFPFKSQRDDQQKYSAKTLSEKQEQHAWDNKNVRRDYLVLAKDLVSKGFYEVALVQLENAAKENPRQAEVHHLKGVCHRELGSYKTAVKDFKKALSINGEFAPAYDGLGITFDLLGEKKKACENFLFAIKLNPARADFYNNIGYSQMGAGNLKNAEQYFEKSITLDPDFRLANNNLAICYGLQGRDNEAFSLFLRYMSASQAWNNMGYIFQRKGEKKKAFTAFKRATELDPKLKAAQKNQTVIEDEADTTKNLGPKEGHLFPPGVNEGVKKEDTQPGLEVIQFEPLMKDSKGIRTMHQDRNPSSSHDKIP